MIDKRILQEILTDQREELAIRARRKFVARPEEEQIDLDSPQAQVVIGVRRCGKSTLCLNALMKSRRKFAYVNFDDERLFKAKGEDLNNILEVLYQIYGDFDVLFIDEVQDIDEWHLFVNRLLRRDMHLVITGSNAKLLSSELMTHLTGRHKAITLYPFSFREFCEYKEVDPIGRSTRNVAEIRRTFDEYLHQGGFPELLHISDHRAYIGGLIDNIVRRDIERRFRIAYKSAFEGMVQHLLNVTPSIVNDSNLAELFSVKSVHTVGNYVSHMLEAYLFTAQRKFSFKSRQRVVGEKFYPIDVAFMNNRENAMAGENLGFRLETVVYLELLRRYKPLGGDIFYYADRSSECDFIVCNGRKVELAVQVSYDISSPRTRKREIAGLTAAAKLKPDQLLLITDHEFDDVTEGPHRIAIRPAYEFCLS